MQKDAFTFECWNPRMKLKIIAESSPTGEGEASTEPVEFAIRLFPLPRRVINVDPNNHGVCHIDTGPGFILSEIGKAKFLSAWDANGNPEALRKGISVTWNRLSINSGEFHVIQDDPSLSGNITYTFFVTYKRTS